MSRSTPTWECLEALVREKAQEMVQRILEEEVTELLGREKSERKTVVDPAPGYRNGYGKARRLAMSSGTIMLRRPRVRGIEERFESRVLPLFARRTKEIGELLPELYLHGLAEGDFELALRGLLGEGAPLSKASIRRLRAVWSSEFETWAKRSLADREVVYVWADGIYVKAGLERDKAALLVVMGAMRDGTKEVLAVTSGYRESTDSWAEVFRALKARCLAAPKLLMADGNAAIWAAARTVMSALAKLATRYVGRTAWLRTDRDKLVFSVRVLDLRVSYGRYEFLVGPLDGFGEAWVGHDRVKQLETGGPV